MRTLITLLNNVRTQGARKCTGALAALLLAGVLISANPAHGMGVGFEVYLGSVSTGYVNVTEYLQTDQYGNYWVDGYDDEPNFEIVLDAATGQVLDPYGHQEGYFTGAEPVG